MKYLEARREAEQASIMLARSARLHPSASTLARIEADSKKLDNLLPDEKGIGDIKGTLDRLRPLVLEWLETGDLAPLLQPRNLRSLCYFLDLTALVDPPLFERESCEKLLAAIADNWKDSLSSPLSLFFLNNFSPYPRGASSVEVVRKILLRNVDRYSGKRPLPTMMKLLSETILAQRNPSILGRQAAQTGDDWIAACESLNAGPAVRSTFFFKIACIEFVKNMQHPELLLSDENFSKLISSGEVAAKIITAVLIDRCGSEAGNIPALTALAFSMIGDASVEAYWKCDGDFSEYSSLLESSRKTVASWINRQVIEYFFQKAEMDGGRKAFWSKYASKITTIRIAMHTGWNFGFSFSGNADVESWIRNRLIKVEAETTDIGLVMEYHDWAIVEIGTHGNACYIYHRSKPIIRNLKNSIRNFSSLKETSLPTLREFDYDGEGRMIHSDGWEYSFHTILRNKMGLTP